ncbi:MAG: phosphotransferase [Anaerolineales bacterium]|nr:phosphotransferase [Anaerolineales bacterium]
MKNISLDQPIAKGNTADVYAWDNGYVLKLFHNWFALEDVEYEFKIAKAVHASGVKSPAVKEIVQVNGRNGLIYERIHGETMFTILKRQPWKVFQFGKLLAQYHIQMHACTFNAEVPEQKQMIQNKIKRANALPVYLKPKLLNALELLPSGNKVCHGDFHPDNILMTKDDSIVIDWIDASKGNPLADVARTSVLAFGAASTLGFGMNLFIKLFHASYLKEYFRLSPIGRDEYQKWIPIVAGARISENITELENWLVKEVRKIE